MVPKMFEQIRTACGDEIELLHDIHERIDPRDAIRMITELDRYRPFFIEDPFPPEPNHGYFQQLRQKTRVPIAMGELFNNPHEWSELISQRLIDYIRVHLSQIGGMTPAIKLAALAEHFQRENRLARTRDVSPVGHARKCTSRLSYPEFWHSGIVFFNQATRDVFPVPELHENGYIHINETPGWGVDIDERLAANSASRSSRQLAAHPKK